MERPTRPTGVANGDNISMPFSTLLFERSGILPVSFKMRDFLRAFLKHWAAFDINIEKMYFLIPLCNVALFIDPYKSVLNSATMGRFVDSNIDRKVSLLSLFL